MRLCVELGLDLVAGAAGAGRAGLAGPGVGAAALDHEALDDAMKGGAVIKPLPGELQEIPDGSGRDIRPEFDGHVAVVGLEDGCFNGCGVGAHGMKGWKIEGPKGCDATKSGERCGRALFFLGGKGRKRGIGESMLIVCPIS